VLDDGVADALEHDAVTPLEVLPHETGDTPRAFVPRVGGELSHGQSDPSALPTSARLSP
jgi:hypothetical protein